MLPVRLAYNTKAATERKQAYYDMLLGTAGQLADSTAHLIKGLSQNCCSIFNAFDLAASDDDAIEKSQYCPKIFNYFVYRRHSGMVFTYFGQKIRL